MNKKRWERVADVALGMVVIVLLNACNHPTPVPTRPTMEPRPAIEGVVGISHFLRVASDGGFVTVYAGVVPGSLPDTNMTGPPTTVAWFSNVGERGQHEKRYDWRPNSQAQYDLVLSNDGSGRTKWTMNEINLSTRVQTPVRSGHLFACDTKDHSYTARAVGFKDCARAIRYDPRELGLNQVGIHQARFASYIKGLETEADEATGPVWISCTSGCCTLGAYY